MNPSINEFESIIVENNYDLNISIKNITHSIKLILGEFKGLLELFSDLDNTLDILCSNFEEENSFNKLQLADDNKTLLGVLLKCKTTVKNKNCILSKFSSYQTIFHFTILSSITSNQEQSIELEKHFNKRFNNLTETIDDKFHLYNKKNKLNKKIKKYKTIGCCTKKQNFNDSIQNNFVLNNNTDFYYYNDPYNDIIHDDNVFYDKIFLLKEYDIKKRILEIINKINNNESIINILENSNNFTYNSKQIDIIQKSLINLKFDSYYI